MPRKEKAVPVMMKDGGFKINGCPFHVDEKYVPITAIGQGSYGVVCSAKDSKLGKRVAIKKIKPMAGDEWDATHTLREIRLMRSFGQHENIISLSDLSMREDKDELYMMMELVDTDLHRLLQSKTVLSEDHLRIMMYQLLHGVKALHDNSVLHRDLKPGNLLVTKECELKITDFGLARMIPKASGKVTKNDELSPMTEYVVTRWYRPPELMLSPNGCYNSAIDMWSVGCIFGEMLNRKPMFPGSDFIDQLTRVFKVVDVPLPEDRNYEIQKDALNFVDSLPRASEDSFHRFCKKASNEAIDLLKHLLCFNPEDRLTVDEALQHSYFNGVTDDWGTIEEIKLSPKSVAFAFENEELPLETLRQYIRDEVKSFQEVEATANNEEPSVPETNEIEQRLKPGHYTAADGFKISGCNFHVSSKYEAVGVLGEGSYGIVCSAQNTETKESVAIKKINPMAGDDWDARHTLREIRLMRHFGAHPNIASVLDMSVCLEKDELYIMMQKADMDLHRLIQSPTVLSEIHIQAIMYQLLCGIEALHRNRAIHRDLKPGNLLVSKRCEISITDFGLSRQIPKGTTTVHLSGNEVVEEESKAPLMTEYVCTRWYRCPEVMLSPNGDYTPAIDMWSSGCILAELINRDALFPGNDVLDQLKRIFSVVPYPTDISERGYKVEEDAGKFLATLDPSLYKGLRQAVPKASEGALSLLSRLLEVNPEKRITAAEALQHSYFDDVRTEWPAPINFTISNQFDFDFDVNVPSVEALKEMIIKEVELFYGGKKSETLDDTQVVEDSKLVAEKSIPQILASEKKKKSSNSRAQPQSAPGHKNPPTHTATKKSSRSCDATELKNKEKAESTTLPSLKVPGKSKDTKAKKSSSKKSAFDNPAEPQQQLLPQVKSSYNQKKPSNTKTAADDDRRNTSYAARRRALANNDVTANPSVLPPGWERRVDSKGTTFYANPSTRKTTRVHPSRIVGISSGATEDDEYSRSSRPSSSSSALPHPWEKKTNKKTGRFYYYNRETKKEYSKLPSSVSAKMIRTAKQSNNNNSNNVSPQSSHHKKHLSSNSPQFSELSLQK